jgi:hypothetical protein
MIDVTEINISTGEIIEREYTQEEINIRNQQQAEIPVEIAKLISMPQTSEDLEYIELKQSAINKLKALGLTEEEAKALAGI